METEYKIKIDLPPDVAAKWVPVAFRYAKDGEWCYMHGEIYQHDSEAPGRVRALILAPRVEWPAWCSADWLMKDADGSVWATTGERPAWNGVDGAWGYGIDGWRLAKAVHADLYAAFEHVPPELSLIENPKRIKSDSTS